VPQHGISGSDVLKAVQRVSSSIGVADLGTTLFSAFAGHLPQERNTT
jgi:hypothetical protein